MALLNRVLISNRGEIAIRIAKAASTLGIESVGVYAPVDSLSLHTRYTTEKREIRAEVGGQGDSVAAYLDADMLIRTAKESGCDCIHPGYGFLSESTSFAEKCASEAVTFIGPPAAALSLFGDKIRARALAQSLDIPVVPGSTDALTSPGEAAELAQDLGYPIMLKVSLGGGGRGMRTVKSTEEMSEAFERCRSEGTAAFGDGSVFIEKLIPRPRHIEVQILADSHGNIVHLHERDCSVQLRNQKVIEVAPAPALAPALRDKILGDAIKLVEAASYVNAGTVEFLISPETSEHFFIECNPRIQVEHTVTEQVTGIDIVEAQFQIASGATLASLGLCDQKAVGAPRGFAIQARVVAQSAGTITAYKEPSGVGVRVDACGYRGYTPPPQFDPLLAKVICASNSSASFSSAVDRTLRALEEFHIGGLPTNLPQLRAILAHPDFRGGDARTSLLAEHPDITSASDSTAGNGALALLEQQAASMSPAIAAAGSPAASTPMPKLQVGDGERTVECPMRSSVIEISVTEGDAVSAGETILVVTAMKMETTIAAPCSGVVTALQPLSLGDTVAAGQVVAVIAPAEDDGGQQSSRQTKGEQTWGPVLDEVATLQNIAQERLAPGSDDRGLVRQRSRGKLTCRERITLLLDEDSFREVGSVAGFATYDEYGGIVDFTAANHVGGWGKIEGRTPIVCADDFTSRGGHADGAIGAKSSYLDRLSLDLRLPSVRMLDGSAWGCSGAAMGTAPTKERDRRAAESAGAAHACEPAGAWTFNSD